MSWTDDLPDDISDVEETEHGFSARVGLPTTEDGWFGRECPECELLFKMNVGSYPSAPEGTLAGPAAQNRLGADRAHLPRTAGEPDNDESPAHAGLSL